MAGRWTRTESDETTTREERGALGRDRMGEDEDREGPGSADWLEQEQVGAFV